MRWIDVPIWVGMVFSLCCNKKLPADTLAGKIEIAAALQNKWKDSDTVFVIARQGQGGPPLAVKKITQPNFPLAYELKKTDVMMPGMEWQGKVDVTVRVDRDGDAMSKSPGDLWGQIHGVTVGDRQANVIVDQIIP